MNPSYNIHHLKSQKQIHHIHPLKTQNSNLQIDPKERFQFYKSIL